MPLRTGGATRSGQIWRSSHPDRLDVDGSGALRALGITTVIDLRNSVERKTQTASPDDVVVYQLPLEDLDDPEYIGRWNHNWATPEFYAWGRIRWSRLWTSVFTAIANAGNGVLIHCASGRDRTGMVDEYRGALNSLLDEIRPEAELRSAATKLL